MISAIVLAADTRDDDDLGERRETLVRSLVWLVSAVVSGVVRDVTLATPVGLGLSEVADQSGCNLVQADAETERLAGAVAVCRTNRVIVMKAGYEPSGRLIEDIDAFVRRGPADAVALVRALPTTALQRVLPDRAPVVGLLLPRAKLVAGKSFRQLAAANRRSGTLTTRAARIG